MNYVWQNELCMILLNLLVIEIYKITHDLEMEFNSLIDMIVKKTLFFEIDKYPCTLKDYQNVL